MSQTILNVLLLHFIFCAFIVAKVVKVKFRARFNVENTLHQIHMYICLLAGCSLAMREFIVLSNAIYWTNYDKP